MLAARRRSTAGSRRRTTAHLQIVRGLAGEIADGDLAGLVVLDAARSLVDVLGLADCRFDLPPFAEGAKPLLCRDGWLTLRGVEWDPTAVGLPQGGFHLPVVARGRTAGRFVCTPRPRPARRPSPERITVALTLADQAASALLLESVA